VQEQSEKRREKTAGRRREGELRMKNEVKDHESKAPVATSIRAIVDIKQQ